ncbi:MAG: hypothetical protein P8188_12180 [Gemmatimonadota bacterium]
MRITVVALGTLLLTACGSPDRAIEAQVRVPDSLVVTQDPELRELALDLLPGLLVRSGLELREPVRLARRSRPELESYLLHKMDEDLPVDRARALVTVYAALGLMEPDTDLRDLLLSVFQEQVAGFYDPDSTALFVMDDQTGPALRPLLAHELVHALQDQAVALDVLTDPAVGNDRATAVQAAVEGHATLVMFEVSAGGASGGGVDLTQVPGFGEQLRTMMADAGAGYPQLSAAPRIVRESVLLPYLEGTSFVLEVWRREGRDDFAGSLPASTEQVLMPERFFMDPRDAPLALSVEVPGRTPLHEDVLGAAEVRVLLEERAGPEAGAAVEGWGGDRFVLVESDEAATVLWVSVWDDAASRDRFIATLGPGLPQDREVQFTPMEVEGHPGALLRMGPAVADVRVTLRRP